MMDTVINKLLLAAENHGEDDDPDHTVGDMQGLLRLAWSLMSVSQRRRLIDSEEVEELVMLGARSEFEVEDLLNELVTVTRTQREMVEAAGYQIMQTEGAFFWETETEVSEDYYDEADAIEAAYHDLKGR